MVIYRLENKNNFIQLNNNIFQSSNICKLVLHLNLIHRLVNTDTLLWWPLRTHHKTSKTRSLYFYSFSGSISTRWRVVSSRVQYRLLSCHVVGDSCWHTSFLEIGHFFGAYWSLTCFYCVQCFSRVSRRSQYNCLINWKFPPSRVGHYPSYPIFQTFFWS